MIQEGAQPNNGTNTKSKQKQRLRLVGAFIRKSRESAGLSQRALGQMFNPAVTTQFISNVERGVTPLPPSHVPVLAAALKVPEEEIMDILDQEYAAKLSGRLGKEEEISIARGTTLTLTQEDSELFKKLYSAFKNANEIAQDSFKQSVQNFIEQNNTAAE